MTVIIEQDNTLRITLEHGNYAYVRSPNGKQWASRYGEEHWRDLVGDKFVYLMALEIVDLTARARKAEADAACAWAARDAAKQLLCDVDGIAAQNAVSESLRARVAALEGALKVALEIMELVDGENDCSRGIAAVEAVLSAAPAPAVLKADEPMFKRELGEALQRASEGADLSAITRRELGEDEQEG